MNDERFTLDTNILVYSVDRRDMARHARAIQIVRRAQATACCLTLQAVSEFYTVVTRKNVMSRREASRIAGYWLDVFPTVAATEASVRSALVVAETERASYWDALLIATAAEAGCTAILTEDMSDGSALYNVRILNPFFGDEIPPAVLRLFDAV
jgi:predicted nucleic acid-binding protein